MRERSSESQPPQRRRATTAGTKSLGPVLNLEEHVQPDWWRRIFNSIYLKTDGDVVDDQKITVKEVDSFSEILRLSPEDNILDLCCGQGRHSLELARREVNNLEGLDRSRHLIQKAKAQAKKEGLNVKFREGDARKLPYLPDAFDLVMLLGNSFGYFETVQDDMRVLKEIFKVLKPWGRLLIDVADGKYLRENFQPRSWEWIDKKHFVCRERSLSLDKQRLISREVVNHIEKGVIVDQFYGERIYTQDSLCEVLKIAGFSDVTFYLDILRIPYTGASSQCLAYCYDKSLVRGIAKEMRISVPEAFFIKPEDTTFDLPFDFPVIVKPNFGDSSFGITQRSVAYGIEELVNAISEIREKFGYDKPTLVEEFLSGKDLSIGIIGNPPESYTPLPITEEDYSGLPPELPRICGYEAKWLPESPYWNIKSIPAQLPEDTEKVIVECCLKLFERLECRDYCRFDWRMDSEGNPKLLEVNPNPGWCWDGHLAKMAKIAGISYVETLRRILEANEQRLKLLEETELEKNHLEEQKSFIL